MALSRTFASKKPAKTSPRPPVATESDEEDTPKQRRPRSTSREVALSPAPKQERSRRRETAEDSDHSDQDSSGVLLLPGVRKSSLRRLNTMFGQRSDDIIDLLELGNSDGALSLITKTLLQTLVDVIPVVERNVRRSKGQRGVYQLNQVISQVREMCHDVQMYKDKAQVGGLIVERIVRPSYLDIAVQITAAFAELESGARSRMSKEDFADYKDNFLYLMKRNLASYLSQQFETVSAGVIKSF